MFKSHPFFITRVIAAGLRTLKKKKKKMDEFFFAKQTSDGSHGRTGSGGWLHWDLAWRRGARQKNKMWF